MKYALQGTTSPARLAVEDNPAKVIAKVYLTDPETHKRTPESMRHAATLETSAEALDVLRALVAIPQVTHAVRAMHGTAALIERAQTILARVDGWVTP